MTRKLILVWFGLTLAVGGYLAYAFGRESQRVFLPGRTSSGHYQIEVACTECHTPFGGVTEDACLECHRAELDLAEDSHPKKKFTDPRNAERVALLDARKCTACHVEHRPEIMHTMDVTLPGDYCYRCHSGVAKERPTHQDLAFDTCASAGCHNFHDNRALYEDFLAKHAAEPGLAANPAVPPRNALVNWTPRPPLAAGQADHAAAAGILASWAASPHAATGLNCTGCHQTQTAWTDRPAPDACAACHELESEGFLTGKHGMRTAAGLAAMSPSDARQPMQSQAHAKRLSCGSCHDPHTVDTRIAAVEACLNCHADEHSKAYRSSPHFGLWQSEVAGAGEPGSGVSCATCHLPREVRSLPVGDRIVVQHNQNANLRPNEKMIRDVCLNCHGLGFSIDALADGELIRRNFVGRPSRHIESIDMAVSRLSGDR